jgi:glucose/arabinose dehydrogenase
MKKKLLVIFIFIVSLALVYGAWFYYKNLRGVSPVFKDPETSIVDLIPNTPLPEPQNNTDFPLSLPKGFAISILAKDLKGARVLVQDGLGNLWVSQTSEGKVSMIETKTGKVTEVFKGLDRPHGLVIDPQNKNLLYIAEENRISKVLLYTEDTLHKILDLPVGGRHYTRTLGFGPDNRLYVSIGSTCDVCYEKDEKIAAIHSMNKDGSDFRTEATGLRNAVFFTWSFVDGKMWATEMGRDRIGDGLPPDEINIVQPFDMSNSEERSLWLNGLKNSGAPDFGWPVCFGKNVHDTNFDKNTYIQNPCNNKKPSYIDLPAHSAPLGLAFVPEEGWPEEYWYNLVVAFHGSWNRTVPTGYKLMLVKLNAKGEYLGMEDFISGWLSKDGKTSLGRPVDVLVLPGGIMYISDDKAGVVYKVAYLGNLISSKNSDIEVTFPKENAVVTSPLKVTGKAKGTWFFEASFPVRLKDMPQNKVLAVGIATAKTDWMTTDFVEFETTLTFENPPTDTGWLVFEKDNPSGLPENDDSFHLPIKFK